MEGKVWAEGTPYTDAQVLAVSISDENPFFSGFYRTTSVEEGRFVFPSLLAGTYILYAFPDTLDAVRSGAYYLGDLQWNESNMIRVDGDVFDVDVMLPSVQQGFAVGEGRICGVFDYPEMEFRAGAFYCHSWLSDPGDVEFCNGGLSNVGVLLLDAAKQRILGFTLTDHTGGFCFRHLPFGTYHVMADVPRYGRGLCEEITLSPSQPDVEELHLYINDRGRVDLKYNEPFVEMQSVVAFPNPAGEVISVSGLPVLGKCSVTIY